MKIYNCDTCGNLIYFENTICVHCGASLGYLPLLDSMSSLEPLSDNKFKALTPKVKGGIFYKKCQNYAFENVCNWMVPETSSEKFCLSCNFNHLIPNLSHPENRKSWHRLEIAKRRLIYSLLRLGLPLQNKIENPLKGLAFSFLEDESGPEIKESEKVLIGHDEGMITMNIAEANDAVREKMRLDMNERYRTLLGHFRHEIGHYYWFLLINNNANRLQKFRETFGDERMDYQGALENYYQKEDNGQWQQNFVSSYASSHPWEDWAESWAHYLHMSDTIETSRSWGLSLTRRNADHVQFGNLEDHVLSFEDMKEQWVTLSTALNSLNRSMGMKDVYPFEWSPDVIEKLRFVQQIIIESKQIGR